MHFNGRPTSHTTAHLRGHNSTGPPDPGTGTTNRVVEHANGTGSVVSGEKPKNCLDWDGRSAWTCFSADAAATGVITRGDSTSTAATGDADADGTAAGDADTGLPHVIPPSDALMELERAGASVGVPAPTLDVDATVALAAAMPPLDDADGPGTGVGVAVGVAPATGLGEGAGRAMGLGAVTGHGRREAHPHANRQKPQPTTKRMARR